MTTIHINTAEGAQYVVSYTPQDTLTSLRDKVQSLHGISLHNREFYCNGLPVPEGQMLQAIGVSPQHRLTAASPRAGMQIQVTPTHIQLSPQQRAYRISPSGAAAPATPQQQQVPLMVNTAGKYSPQTSPQHSPSFYHAQSLPVTSSHTLSPMQNVSGSGTAAAAITTASGSRSRSGSVSVDRPHAATLPAPRPAPSERRRHSVSMPGTAPNPFQQLEQTLKKVEKHEKQHPIPSELYDKEPKNGAATAPATASGSGSSSSSSSSHSPSSHAVQSGPSVDEIRQDSARPKTPDRAKTTASLGLKSSASSSHLSVSPHPKHVQPSPPGSPGSGGSTSSSGGGRPRSRSAAEAAPSVSSFQPILSYNSKITALEIALQELVEERDHLDKKTAEERTRIEASISERKKELEEVIWQHQKQMHIVSAMVDDWNARKATVEEELARTKQQQLEQIKHYEELVTQRQAEIDKIRLEAKQAEIQREGVLEEVKSKIAQYTAVRDDVRRDSDRAMEMSVRGIVDALVRGGVTDVVEAEIKARKPH